MSLERLLKKLVFAKWANIPIRPAVAKPVMKDRMLLPLIGNSIRSPISNFL